MSELGFSWSDGFRAAVSSCLPCFTTSPDTTHSPDDHRPRNALAHTAPPTRARPDELEGLLVDSDSADADTMSLHSRIGDERRRKRRRRQRRGIRVFGFDLFGRPPIYLESDDEDGARTHNVSSSTLDSDAAPLDALTIEQLSTARLAAATAAAEEEHRLAKEERRRLRRERKELKRAALAMGLGLRPHEEGGADEFEGFQGSGPASAPVLHAFARAGPGSGSGSGTLSPSADEFGPFAEAGAHPASPLDEADVGGADFGGAAYARRTPRGASSGTGSDSHSRTSGSLHAPQAQPPAYYAHNYGAQQPAPLALPPTEELHKKKRRKSVKGRSQSSAQSESSHGSAVPSSQSPSLPSPPAHHVAFHEPRIAMVDDQFEGFPGAPLEQELAVKEDLNAEGGFPSVGLRGPQRRKSDMGVFLARRGDE